MNIELRHLRYFVAVADEASFTAAAQRVHVAQQVLSAQIRQLEDAVGTQLLNRTKRAPRSRQRAPRSLRLPGRRWPAWTGA